MKFQIKQNDTLPLMTATLKNADGTTIPLVGASVKFIMAIAPGEAQKGGSCVILDAANGVVRYEWAATDTAEAGEYQGEFQITYADGTKLTVPNSGYILVEVLSDLGN